MNSYNHLEIERANYFDCQKSPVSQDDLIEILKLHNFTLKSSQFPNDVQQITLCAAVSICLFSTPRYEQQILSNCLKWLKDVLHKQVLFLSFFL